MGDAGTGAGSGEEAFEEALIVFEAFDDTLDA